MEVQIQLCPARAQCKHLVLRQCTSKNIWTKPNSSNWDTLKATVVLRKPPYYFPRFIYSVAPRRTAIIHPSAPLQALTHPFIPSLNMLPNKQVWIWLLKGCSFRTRSMEDAYSHKLHLHEIQHWRATFCKGQLSSGVTVHLFLLQSLSSSSPFPHNHSEEILFCGASGHLPSEKFILHKKKEA